MVNTKYNKPNSLGTYIWKSGAKYLGEYKDSDRHGYGSESYADGSRYTG